MNTRPCLHILAHTPYTHHSTQDTLQIARLLGDDDKTFIPTHLEPPPVDALVGNSNQAMGLDPRKRH